MANDIIEVIDVDNNDAVLVSESNEIRKDIKILVRDGEASQRLYTLNIPLPYSDMDIITSIFPNDQILMDNLGYKLVDDSTVRRLQVSAIVDDPTIQHVINVQSPTMKLRESNNFGKLLNSKTFSDVTLRVSGKKIYAHKVILADKSPVFKAMFTHGMDEIPSNKIIEVKDVDYHIMHDLLYYIYAGKLADDCLNRGTNNNFRRYSNLLKAAVKYCVESLRVKCEDKLPLFLTTANVFDCFILADSLKLVTLKRKVINFIVENIEKIIELPSYKSFVEFYADLSIEIVRSLVAEKRNHKSVEKKRKSKSRNK